MDYVNGHDCHFCGERVPLGYCHRRGYSRTTGWSACELSPIVKPKPIRCTRCGGEHLNDRSCLCFDNGSE